MILKKLCKLIFDSNYRFNVLSMYGFLNGLPDSKYLEIAFRRKLGYRLNLESPQSFNEKLQYLKLHDRRELYTRLVDKYEVKDYVRQVLGDECVIPTIGVWNSFEEIDFSALPNRFVMKCTHDSGGVFICKNKDFSTKESVVSKLNNSMKHNYYYSGREWPYKNVPPRIIAEEYLEDDSTSELRDYKFFCFNGVVKCFKIDFDRFSNHRANYYDTDGNILPFGESSYPPDYERTIDLPKSLSKMLEYAEKLSSGIPFIRIDFYEVNGRVYFGEATLFPASGLGSFTDVSWDYILGSWLDIRTIKS